MKKMVGTRTIKAVVAIATVFAMLLTSLSIVCMAEAEDISATFDETNSKFVVSGEVEGLNGKQVTIMVLKPGSESYTSDSDILYIDQKAADGDTYSFDVPAAGIEAGQTAIAKVGGVGATPLSTILKNESTQPEEDETAKEAAEGLKDAVKATIALEDAVTPLSTEAPEGYTAVWTASQDGIINAAGKIQLPSKAKYPDGLDVTLTVTVSENDGDGVATETKTVHLDPVTYADLNSNDSIDMNDRLGVANGFLGLKTLTDSELYLVDVNGDGKLNVLDLDLIGQKFMSQITAFPVEE